MPRLIVEITEEQKAKLEEHRAAMGLRSLADAFRHLIDRYSSKRPSEHRND